MGILEFAILAAVIGFVTYLLTRFVPMPAEMKKLIVIVVVGGLALWLLLYVLNLGSWDVPIPRLR